MADLDWQTYAMVQRDARIAAEDRAVEAEARLRAANNKIRDLETLMVLYRPEMTSQPQPVQEVSRESGDTRVWSDGR